MLPLQTAVASIAAGIQRRGSGGASHVSDTGLHARPGPHASRPMHWPSVQVSPAVHVMLSGSVRIVTDDGINAIELAHIDQPAVIGETGVISGRRRNASVYASSETEMLRIDGQVVIELLEQVPGVAIALVRELVGRLQQSNDKLLQYHAEAPT